MKNIPLLFIAILLYSCSTDDSPIVENTDTNEVILNISTENIENGVFSGNVTLVSQEAIDIFGELDITGVIGNMTIGDFINPDITINSNITDFTPLNGLIEINGTLKIFNTEISNLNGLQNLISLSGLVIEHNENLENTVGLSSQLMINNTLIIRDNDILTSLPNLISTTHISNVDIIFNQSLENLSGLENLVSVDFLNISSNTSLVSLQGLDNLSTINNEFIMQKNSILLNLEGLQNLTAVSNDETDAILSITENNNLSNLDGLENLNEVNTIQIGGFIDIGNDVIIGLGNNNLTDLCALQGLFLDGTFDTVIIDDNGFNPTIGDIQAGNCGI